MTNHRDEAIERMAKELRAQTYMHWSACDGIAIKCVDALLDYMGEVAHPMLEDKDYDVRRDSYGVCSFLSQFREG